MMMRSFSLLVVIGAFVMASSVASAGETHPGEAVYQRCAACHLPDGAGVPGAFPPLRKEVRNLASTEKGREYLTFVVLNGVSGRIDVNGVQYRGMMPAVAKDLDDAQIADLLNYLLSAVVVTDNTGGPSTAQTFVSFSADEVEVRRAAITSAHTHRAMLKTRSEALREILKTQKQYTTQK